MEFIKALAAFGIVEVTTGNAIAIAFHQYADSTVKHLIFPFLKNFVDLNELKLGDMYIGKFIKETILFWFSIGVAFYLLSMYMKYFVKEEEKEVKEKNKKDILKELGIDKKRLMYAMV